MKAPNLTDAQQAALGCLVDGPYTLGRGHQDYAVFASLLQTRPRLIGMVLGLMSSRFYLTDAGRAALAGAK